MKYDKIDELIGNTPLVKIDEKVHGFENVEIYAKMELMNPFGSVKDRVAKGLLYPRLEEAIEKDMTVVEASSGNTGKALSVLCNIHNLKFKSYTNRIKVNEQRMILQLLEADIEELPGLSDCPDPNDPNDPTKLCSDLVNSDPDKYLYTDQYFNELNTKIHYETTGKEIYDDLGDIDIFFGALGTCGSSMGAGMYLKEKNPEVKLMGVVASEGNWVPGGRNTNELWEVGLFEKKFYAQILNTTIQEAIDGLLELNRKCGLMCGPSTGMIYFALKEWLKENHKGEPLKIVFLACDRLEPYMGYIKKFRPELFSSVTTSRETVFSQSQEQVESAKPISADQLNEILREKPMIVDIRGGFGYSIGHIEGSINILDEVFAIVCEEGKPFPINTKLVVVCSVGKISKKFVSFLSAKGYDAMYLEGGVLEWKKKHELVKNG